MRLYPQIQLTARPRMADFARWGCAIAEALGYDRDVFLEAYRHNRQLQNREAIAEHPVGTSVCRFMQGRTEWSGTATQLLSALAPIADELGINCRFKSWPSAPSVLSRQLNEIKANLSQVGIEYESHHSGTTMITLLKSVSGTTAHTVHTAQSSSDQGHPPVFGNVNNRSEVDMDDVDDVDGVFPLLFANGEIEL